MRRVLFDLDGTLVDSSPLHAQAFRETLERHAPELAGAFDYDRIRGMETTEAFRTLGAGERPAEQLATEKRNRYRTMLRDGALSAMAGAAQLLGALQRHRISYGLVTSGSRASVTEALAATGLTGFDTIVTADDVASAKPHPEPYLKALAGADRMGAVAIEDAPSGAASARAAGLLVWGVHNEAVVDSVDLFVRDLFGVEAELFGKVAR